MLCATICNLQHTKDSEGSFSQTDLKYIYKNRNSTPSFSKSPNGDGRRHCERDTETNSRLSVFMYRAEAKRKITVFSVITQGVAITK